MLHFIFVFAFCPLSFNCLNRFAINFLSFFFLFFFFLFRFVRSVSFTFRSKCDCQICVHCQFDTGSSAIRHLRRIVDHTVMFRDGHMDFGQQTTFHIDTRCNKLCFALAVVVVVFFFYFSLIIYTCVLWFEMMQMKTLRQLMQGERDLPKAPLGNNFRLPHSLHRRVVRTSILDRPSECLAHHHIKYQGEFESRSVFFFQFFFCFGALVYVRFTRRSRLHQFSIKPHNLHLTAFLMMKFIYSTYSITAPFFCQSRSIRTFSPDSI